MRLHSLHKLSRRDKPSDDHGIGDVDTSPWNIIKQDASEYVKKSYSWPLFFPKVTLLFQEYSPTNKNVNYVMASSI